MNENDNVIWSGNESVNESNRMIEGRKEGGGNRNRIREVKGILPILVLEEGSNSNSDDLVRR